MEHIVKVFPGVRAVDDVDFELRPGEIHALLGHNGAGKSTLMKIISGAYRKDSGVIRLSGREVDFSSPSDALQKGIGMVYQELDLIPWLDGSENIFLGQKKFYNRLGLLNRKARRKAAEELVGQMGVDIDLSVPVRQLSISKQQLIVIVKAISRDARLIVFDEPTAALNEAEVEKLFKIMRMLTERGIALILITHRLDEVFQTADRVTLMRNGKRLFTADIGDVTMSGIVAAMTGAREGEDAVSARASHARDAVALECRNLSGGAFKDVSFRLHEGEVLGITGLIGCGATEMAKALFGAYRVHSGQMLLKGKPLASLSPRAAVKNGMAFLSENRKTEGLNLVAPVRTNLSISIQKKLSRLGFIRFAAERALTDGMIKQLAIRITSPRQLVNTLSGGNQQKVVFGKWLLKNAGVFIMCEPTRGIDVGTKREIHRIIRQLAADGMAMLVVSSEIEEIMDTCDRILFLYEGRITSEVRAGGASKERMMNLMYGMT